MGALRHTRSFNANTRFEAETCDNSAAKQCITVKFPNKLHKHVCTIPGKFQVNRQDMSPSPGYSSGLYPANVNQGLPTLLVMIAVLIIILMFCFWGSPPIRAFCRRKICCFCPMDEPTDGVTTTEGSSTPTIILLPYGRMLVVDRTVFAQLQADNTGIDFLELGANIIRAERSASSVLDSDATSKGLSPIDFSPPTYEEIFGCAKNFDLPPSYSEVSLMFKRASNLPITRDDVVGLKSFGPRCAGSLKDVAVVQTVAEKRSVSADVLCDFAGPSTIADRTLSRDAIRCDVVNVESSV